MKADLTSALDTLTRVGDDPKNIRVESVDLLAGRNPREMVLMCGDTPVMSMDFDRAVYDILDEEHLPFNIRAGYKKPLPEKEYYTKYEMTQAAVVAASNKELVINWLGHRILLLSRANAKWIYNALRIEQNNSLNNRARMAIACRAVSIQDNYWLKLAGDKTRWDSVNIRHNPLNRTIAQIALHGKSVTIQGSICSPELTTNGAYAKAWRRYADGSLWLHKYGATDASESKVEVCVSNLLDGMNVDHVPYIMTDDEDKRVCACPAITSDNISIVSAGSYIAYLTQLGKDADWELRQIDGLNIDKMAIVDYLISNRDRHGENWGLIYDPESMRLLGCHPLFDHNNAFAPEYMDDEDAKYQVTSSSIKATALKASKNVDLHFTRKFTRKDFLTTRMFETFSKRASYLGIKVIPETPIETAERLVKRECLCRNRYDMVSVVMDALPVVGSEMSETDIHNLVRSTADEVVPKIIINGEEES